MTSSNAFRVCLYDGSGGIVQAKLKAGVDTKSQVQFKGKGGMLGIPDPSTLTSPIVVQLLIDDGSIECFKTTFAAPFAKQDSKSLKTKGP